MERQVQHPFGIGISGGDPNDQMVCGHCLFHQVTPLDDGDAVVDQLVEAQVVKVLNPVEAIHVDVPERQPALVFLHDREGRAGHPFVDAQAVREPLRERGLARSEVADEQHEVAGHEEIAERAGNRAGGLG